LTRRRRTIALDFDGVLHRYNGYNNGLINGPIPGAREAVEQLLRRGHTVVVFSTRDQAIITTWLAQHGFPPLEVTDRKRPFYVIVDDRAFCFEGLWDAQTVQSLERFAPYWIKNRTSKDGVDA